MRWWQASTITLIVLSLGMIPAAAMACDEEPQDALHEKLLIIDGAVFEAMSHEPEGQALDPGAFQKEFSNRWHTHMGGIATAPDGTSFTYGPSDMKVPAVWRDGIIVLRPDTSLAEGRRYLRGTGVYLPEANFYTGWEKITLPAGTDPEAFRSNHEAMEILLGPAPETFAPREYELQPLHKTAAYDYLRQLLKGEEMPSLYSAEHHMVTLSLGLHLPFTREKFQEVYGDEGNALFDEAQKRFGAAATRP